MQNPPRHVPIHLQAAYKEELTRLTELGIVSEVQNEYTLWINSTLVTPKSEGSIRLCLDPRDLNRAVKRNPYYVRTVDDVIPQINGATHFSILDALVGIGKSSSMTKAASYVRSTLHENNTGGNEV